MQSILVTGGAGFIGSNFVRYLLQVEPRVKIVNLDLLTYAGRLENLVHLPDPARHSFVHGNIGDRVIVDDLLERHAIDTIIHFAAETHVDRSIQGPEKFIQSNIVGTFNLLEAARRHGNIRFHHVSTDEVFGTLGPNDPPFRETTPYAPNSPYSASKASSDHLVRAYFHTYHLPVTITNCSNNYGPYQFPEKLIPLMILNALSNKPLPIYGDGQQIRDWLYVEDHCEAIWQVVREGREGETYNVGGDNQPTNLTIVETICAILDGLSPRAAGQPYRELIHFVNDRPGHDRRYAMDIGKIGQELGWRPRESLESGLYKTVRWYVENPDWIATIHSQSDYSGWLEKNYANREVKK